jgi:hypothetical protein
MVRKHLLSVLACVCLGSMDGISSVFLYQAVVISNEWNSFPRSYMHSNASTPSSMLPFDAPNGMTPNLIMTRGICPQAPKLMLST